MSKQKRKTVDRSEVSYPRPDRREPVDTFKEVLAEHDKSVASSCSACDGCKYQHLDSENGWCYMFRNKPETLPCGQHDKFSAKRKATGSLVRKNPQMLAFMIMEMRKNENIDLL
jgi:hypothetical protein